MYMKSPEYKVHLYQAGEDMLYFETKQTW